jgi:putative phosphoesterase
MLVGLVSDTHSLIRPELFTALAGVDLILHAGDVGGSGVLTGLGAIAPVQAVFGNTDDPADPALRAEILVDVSGLSVHVSHGHELGNPTSQELLSRFSADVIVFGHTHKPLVERAGARLVVNPGAAGPRRFSLKPSVARMRVEGGQAAVEIVWL